jgi:hypothetical protein
VSRFITEIPVDVAGALQLLPKNSYLEGVRFDKETSSVVIEWQHDPLETGYTFSFGFPLENLRAQKLPPGVRLRRPALVPAEPVAVKPKPDVMTRAQKKAAAKACRA